MSKNKKDSVLLAENQCTTCHGGVEPLKGEAIEKLLEQPPEGWQAVDEGRTYKDFPPSNPCSLYADLSAKLRCFLSSSEYGQNA